MATRHASIGETFFFQARRIPDKLAIHCEEVDLTYEELAQLVCRWSNAMAANGVARGDHIAVMLPNVAEFVALILVAADLGAVLVPLNPALTVRAAYTSFRATDVRHVVTTSNILQRLQRGGSDHPAAVPGLWLSIDEPIHHEGADAGLSLTCLLRDVASDAPPRGEGIAEDALILSMTSGSTGAPKPIILTQQTKSNRVNAAVELYSITESDKVLAATPLYHSLAERLVLIPLMTGGTSILMPRFSPAAWIQCVRQQRATFTIAVSSQLKQISAALRDPGHSEDVASLRCIVSSSALLDWRIKGELLQRFGCEFHECYGASEVAIASNLNDSEARVNPRSVGKAAPGVCIKIVDKDGKAVTTGEIGEIACKTPMLFGGYYKREDLTRLAMCGDYFRTGDIGRLDDDNFLYFLGRSKDIIITGGINVYPADIESVVNEHPSVLESAAFSLPDERLGEIVAVALTTTDPEFDMRKLRFHCSAHLADYQQPRKIFVMPALPKNAMGKLLKFRLGEIFAEQAHGSAETVR